MTEDKRERERYYRESSPSRRRAVLEEAAKGGQGTKEDEIRLQIWELRYGRPGEKGQTGRADRYLKLWMDMKYLAENPPGRFGMKKTQRRLEEDLDKLGFVRFYEESETSRGILYQECLHVVRLYIQLCFSDRNYTSLVLGMMPMKKGKVQDKISKDLKTVYQDLPSVIKIPQPLELLLKAAQEMEQELKERYAKEEWDERI